MTRCRSVWQFVVLLVAAHVVAEQIVTCPKNHVCETADECASRHGGAEYLESILIFDCATGGVCCPPWLDRSSTEMRRKAKFMEATKRRKNTLMQVFDMKNCGKQAVERIFGPAGGVDPGDYPWMAILSVLKDDKVTRTFHCGGTLISKRYVLTAAHCVVGTNRKVYDSLMVRLGETDTRKDPDCDELDTECLVPNALDFGVEKVVHHKKYSLGTSSKSVNFDIALVRLDRSVGKFSTFVLAICLPFGEKDMMAGMVKGTNFTVVGWGLDMTNMQSPVMKKGHVMYVTPEDCQSELDGPKLVAERQTCTVPMDSNACMGDSGGPLTSADLDMDAEVQLGIVSYSKVRSCSANPDDVVVYTKVYGFKNWILDTIHSLEKRASMGTR